MAIPVNALGKISASHASNFLPQFAATFSTLAFRCNVYAPSFLFRNWLPKSSTSDLVQLLFTSLHWLLLRSPIKNKILSLTLKALHNLASPFLFPLISHPLWIPPPTLCSLCCVSLLNLRLETAQHRDLAYIITVSVKHYAYHWH